jgi:hypothetical protein
MMPEYIVSDVMSEKCFCHVHYQGQRKKGKQRISLIIIHRSEG